MARANKVKPVVDPASEDQQEGTQVPPEVIESPSTVDETFVPSETTEETDPSNENPEPEEKTSEEISEHQPPFVSDEQGSTSESGEQDPPTDTVLDETQERDGVNEGSGEGLDGAESKDPEPVTHQEAIQSAVKDLLESGGPDALKKILDILDSAEPEAAQKVFSEYKEKLEELQKASQTAAPETPAEPSPEPPTEPAEETKDDDELVYVVDNLVLPKTDIVRESFVVGLNKKLDIGTKIKSQGKSFVVEFAQDAHKSELDHRKNAYQTLLKLTNRSEKAIEPIDYFFENAEFKIV